MKKMVSVLATVGLSMGTSLFATGYACCFSGWDVTVGVGFSTVQVENVFEDAAVTFRAEDYQAQGSVAVQGKTGYHCGFCDNWLLGVSVYGQYNNASSEIEQTHTNFSASIKDKLPVDLGIEVRGGYAYCSNQLIYLGIGPDWVYFEETLRSTRHGTASHSRWFVGPRLMGGAEQRVCGKLILKEEFAYSWYSQYTKDYTNGTATLRHEITPSLPTFMFSAGYLF